MSNLILEGKLDTSSLFVLDNSSFFLIWILLLGAPRRNKMPSINLFLCFPNRELPSITSQQVLIIKKYMNERFRSCLVDRNRSRNRMIMTILGNNHTYCLVCLLFLGITFTQEWDSNCPKFFPPKNLLFFYFLFFCLDRLVGHPKKSTGGAPLYPVLFWGGLHPLGCINPPIWTFFFFFA